MPSSYWCVLSPHSPSPPPPSPPPTLHYTTTPLYLFLIWLNADKLAPFLPLALLTLSGPGWIYWRVLHSVCLPFFQSQGRKKKGFWWRSLSEGHLPSILTWQQHLGENGIIGAHRRKGSTFAYKIIYIFRLLFFMCRLQRKRSEMLKGRNTGAVYCI